MSSTITKPKPTLEELLARRGVHKDKVFGDYQDYIESKEKSIKPSLIGNTRIPIEGSMHLALGRIIKTPR